MDKQATEPQIEMVSEAEHRRRLAGFGRGLNRPLKDEEKRAEREHMEKHFTTAGKPRKGG